MNKPSKSHTDIQQKAWVAFSNEADLPWLRLLRPGFRHCFVLMQEGGVWLSVDPLLNHMEVHVHSDITPDFDFPRWLMSRGHIVLPAPINRSKTSAAPWRPLTCVEAIKRILGIHARRVITPWQLYKYLRNQSEEKSEKRRLNHGKPQFAS